jgi:hypothetical protein
MKKFFTLIFFSILLMQFQPALASSDPNYPSAIISISPTFGYESGGNIVTIIGINFDEDTFVRVGGTTAATTFNSSSELSVVMPPKSVGFVSIGVFDGSVGAILPNSYEYLPDPTPTPMPTPTPTPTPTLTPTPTPTPTPTLTAVEDYSPSSQTTNQTEDVKEQEVSLHLTDQIFHEVVEESPKTVYLSDNSYVVYGKDYTENIVVKTYLSVPQKFVLRERVNKKWVYVDRSYYFNGKVIFLNTNLKIGSTYKVVVENNNKKTIVSWFTVYKKIYEVK